MPVIRSDCRLFLKVAHVCEEQYGNTVMAYWRGSGAARVFEVDGPAILLERAVEPGGLLALTKTPEGDDEASRILCRTLKVLHKKRLSPPPSNLVTLTEWFGDLERYASDFGHPLVDCRDHARQLLASPETDGVLHGDLHHGNVLNFGYGRGWLAIDPKAVKGDFGFDYAALFSNPELDVARQRSRFKRQLEVVVEQTDLTRRRLLMWISAQAGLSALWFLRDNRTREAEPGLEVARFAQIDLKQT